MLLKGTKSTLQRLLLLANTVTTVENIQLIKNEKSWINLMRIILIGIPGAGKSTQGNLLSKQLKLPYLSTGHIFRLLSKEKTQQGRYIKEMLHSGNLIPDAKTLPIVEEYLSRSAYKRGYILDGFPRTVRQAKEFKHELDSVLYLTLEDKDALWRIAYRTEERDDQAAATIIHRINTFHQNTDPVIEHYREAGLLEEIDGGGTVEEVNEAILRTLGKSNIDHIVKTWEQRDKIIIALTGLAGSGKSQVSAYLNKTKEHPVIHFGKVINDILKHKGLSDTEDDHRKVRNELREEGGMAAIAEKNIELINKALSDSAIVIIDDMRSYEEYEYLQKVLPKVKIYIVALWAQKNERYERIKTRASSQVGGPDRDIHELTEANMGTTIAQADYLIENNGSVEDLEHKVEHVYREIYFGLD